jgi:glyoxylase-like metal-dependent hydrolase (beta-lactamase superfamily II)
MGAIEVVRLYYGSILTGPVRENLPMHGYAIKHPKGVVLVDTGMGWAPDTFRPEWKLLLRSAAEALADHGLSPVDVQYVINTHLHSDHCGQNVVFGHTPVIVQQVELERARREQPELLDRFDHINAKFELLDGDTEVLPGVHAIATPGHTTGHQSVVVQGDSPQVIVGDAAYTIDLWERPESLRDLSETAQSLQVHTHYDEWCASIEKLRAYQPDVDLLHFCHDEQVLPGGRVRQAA